MLPRLGMDSHIHKETGRRLSHHIAVRKKSFRRIHDPALIDTFLPDRLLAGIYHPGLIYRFDSRI
jgi:hypothetical protein